MALDLVPIDQRQAVMPSQESEFDVRVYVDALRRRYLYLVIPPIVIFAVICIVTLFLLPSVYQSTARILVVSQLIPNDLATSTVAASATERIKVIEQRLTTRDNLLSIARKHQLYPKQRSMLTPSTMVEWLREATKIDQIALSTSQPQWGKPGTEVVGFNLSFEYYDPTIAARVANDLVASILEQNIQSRAARAAETSKFFTEQVKRLEAELATVENKIAEFKKVNEAASPETLADRRERLAQLQSTLATIDQMTSSGLGPQDAVEAKADLKGLSSRLQSAQQQLKNAEEQRAGLEKLHAKGYVTKTRLMESANGILRLQAEIDELTGRVTVAQGKLSEIGGDPESLPKRRAEIERQVKALQESVARTPEVEGELNALLREYENLKTDYRLAQGKTNVAATGEQMEEDRQAERFEVIEQADVPSEPARPNRPQILLFGAAFSVGAGVALVLLLEMLDKSIRSPKDLERLLQIRPLVTIPYVATTKEKAKKAHSLKRSMALAIILLTIGVVVVSQFVLPLDVIARKLIQLPKFYGLI